jgi:PUA domain protein
LSSITWLSHLGLCKNQLRVYNLSKKNRDEILSDLHEFSTWNPPKLDDLKIAENEDLQLQIIYQLDKRFFIAQRAAGDHKRYFPLLMDEQILPLLPVVKVDSGAVKFVCNGANIMRPGILSIQGNLQNNGLSVIREQKYEKSISVGKAMYPGGEIEAMSRGPVLENLHYVGDKYWEALKELAK